MSSNSAKDKPGRSIEAAGSGGGSGGDGGGGAASKWHEHGLRWLVS